VSREKREQALLLDKAELYQSRSELFARIFLFFYGFLELLLTDDVFVDQERAQFFWHGDTLLPVMSPAMGEKTCCGKRKKVIKTLSFFPNYTGKHACFVPLAFQNLLFECFFSSFPERVRSSFPQVYLQEMGAAGEPALIIVCFRNVFMLYI
jgi:hypothetical protein